LTRKDMSALRKLQMWLDYAEMWCEHNPSTTINLKEHEWDEAGKFVYANFDKIAGVAFFPYDDHTYAQAPYQEITEEKYHELVAEMPKNVDWDILASLEHEDNTSGSQELACVGGSCEIAA
jgi:ribonucleoside-triphosphate reductase